jgi:beta-lactamase regulating signal transducer with metallopeptidase domain
MTESLMLQAVVRFACPVVVALFAASLKASLLLAFVFLAVWVMKPVSARLKHLLLLLGLAGSLFVLILSFRGPLFQLAPPQMPVKYQGALAAVSSTLLPSSGTFAPRMPPLAAEMWRQASLGNPWFDLWPAAVLFLWMAGVLSGWLRILLGRLHLLKLAKAGQRDRAEHYESLAEDLARRLGIARKVRVFVRESCRTPLTYGIFRPVVVLPAGMETWSSESARSVLMHELRHIKRGDSFWLALAYGICSLFWFVPPLWAAYARLYLEQEKTCDAAVVESGVKRHTYAAAILDAAQFCREPVLFAGLSFSRRRRHVLQDRIRSVVRGGKIMRKGVVLFGFFALLWGAITVMSASGIDTTGLTGKKYGKLYLTEYSARTADEASILNLLVRYEAAFNSHDLQKLLSLFAKDATYRPCGVDWKDSIGSKQCQDRLRLNFDVFRFETYYDPRITVNGDHAVVALLLESGDYLADYFFVLKKDNLGWLVWQADYANDHAKS